MKLVGKTQFNLNTLYMVIYGNISKANVHFFIRGKFFLFTVQVEIVNINCVIKGKWIGG